MWKGWEAHKHSSLSNNIVLSSLWGLMGTHTDIVCLCFRSQKRPDVIKANNILNCLAYISLWFFCPRSNIFQEWELALCTVNCIYYFLQLFGLFSKRIWWEILGDFGDTCEIIRYVWSGVTILFCASKSWTFILKFGGLLVCILSFCL